jgi:hypothetical protein
LRVQLYNYNALILDTIHKMLLDKKTMEGWTTMYIYYKDNNYLYSHSSNNKIYKQTGDRSVPGDFHFDALKCDMLTSNFF